MTPIIPAVQPLPHKHRRWVFAVAFVSFMIMVPVFVFYAIGYRYSFSGELSNITSVGGMYITADADDIGMYIDDAPVKDMRIFQQAAYIQNLEAGLHQIHTQGEGVQTWVKILPVYSHFVTEARSFNMPAVPQLRLVTMYQTQTGQDVLFEYATSTQFAFASTTNNFFVASTTATSTYRVNPEHTSLVALFASSTAEKALRQKEEALRVERFSFSTATSTAIATSSLFRATSTKVAQDLKLIQEGSDVFAVYTGDDGDRPHYFCITFTGATSTAVAYGTHVFDQLVLQHATSTIEMLGEVSGMRLCRDQVRIDRLWQSVQYFDFMPDNNNQILMHLQDGVYVVEIDDRAWQNTQLLYPGDYLEVLIEDDKIFIQDGTYILEVFTTIQ